MRKELEKKRVSIGGIRQNCFALDVRMDTSAQTMTPPTIKSYFSLEKKTLNNGFVQELEKIDYPITSDSVTSYMDSSDYKRDPFGAVANAPKRVNLGDITEVQQFIENDPLQAVRLYREVGEKLEQYYQEQQAKNETATAEPVADVTAGGATNE